MSNRRPSISAPITVKTRISSGDKENTLVPNTLQNHTLSNDDDDSRGELDLRMVEERRKRREEEFEKEKRLKKLTVDTGSNTNNSGKIA